MAHGIDMQLAGAICDISDFHHSKPWGHVYVTALELIMAEMKCSVNCTHAM